MGVEQERVSCRRRYLPSHATVQYYPPCSAASSGTTLDCVEAVGRRVLAMMGFLI